MPTPDQLILIDLFVALVLMVGFLVGIRRMQSPESALTGNRLGAICMAVAIVYTMGRTGSLADPLPWTLLLTGGCFGVWIAWRVTMIQMPQTVALFNGLGGAASALVAAVAIASAAVPLHMPPTGQFAGLLSEAFPGAAVLVAGSSTGTVAGDLSLLFVLFTAILALSIGPLTFAGSIVAALKLHNILSQPPLVLKGHSGWMGMLLLMGLLLIASLIVFTPPAAWFWLLALIFGLYGLLMTLRIGGADMPIIIALLNSLSGVAAALAGLSVKSALLIGVGALVGVAGLVLTAIMCRAMNRSLASVLSGFTPEDTDPTAPAGDAPALEITDERVPALLAQARSVVLIPGYGMALAQAQQPLKQLSDRLERLGKRVHIALHPVAGRMTAHMNVLLAEVGFDDRLIGYPEEMNPLLAEADLAIVVGASDVVNPAAASGEISPIMGLEILHAEHARHVIVCNRDNKPGYSGVKNALYERKHVLPLWGNASHTLSLLTQLLPAPEVDHNIVDEQAWRGSVRQAVNRLDAARSVILVPGYGMAVAQAQLAVKELLNTLLALGKKVDIAVHPVAGRMPGHMNVLLAEVGVAYDMLHDMKEINPRFERTDAVVIVGACDVVNPAASTAKGTPIYGMPVLQVEKARTIIVCNRDEQPGYSGVANTLYGQPHTITLWADAALSLPAITEELRERR